MDHVVYVDAKENEMERLLSGEKTMILRGAAGRKLPYDRIHEGETLYLINNNAEGCVKAIANVKRVIQSGKMTREESFQMLDDFQSGLQLSPAQQKRWGGKRFIVIMELDQVQEIEPIPIDKSDYGNMDDWLPVGSIDSVRSKL